MATKVSYIGLSCTLHDPALAIVNSSGDVVFAEGAERYLQTKRAFNSPPDSMDRIAALIDRHCGDDDLVLARTWTRGSPEVDQQVRAVFEAARQNPRLELDAAQRAVLQEFGFSGESLEEEGPHYMLAMFHCLTHSNPLAVAQSGLNLAFQVAVNGARPGRKVSFREYDHHLTHATCGAGTSPFDEAVVAVMDGSGEGIANTFFAYRGGTLELIPTDHGRGLGSLGFFYWFLCHACGFDPLKGEEWKVMGLAPYGRVDDELYDLMRSMLDHQSLALRLGSDFSKKLTRLFRMRRPRKSSPLEAANLARTGQQVFCDVAALLLDDLARLGISDNLVVTGGCGLNSAWNGQILARTPFKALHVFSAPADDGNAIGAAMLAHAEDQPPSRARATLHTPFLGESASRDAIERIISLGGLKNVRASDRSLAQQTAEFLVAGKIVGWMQGRAEFGPRALGNRSILADPRPAAMKDHLNARVKFREEFRPFAPAILEEHGAEWFEDYQSTPYMERALRFRESAMSRVAAVVHVDGTGRLQSVRRDWNPPFHALITEFYKLTGVPIVLNTSFNVMGKPIVHSVEDAVAVFFSSGIDVLVIEDVVITK